MPASQSGSPTSWTPPSVEELDRLLPQYEIDAVLGRGGMGAVYQGHQASLGRKVAIKVLPEHLIAGDAEDNHQYVERFKLEARSMGSSDSNPIKDDTWTSFRLRWQGGRFQTWVDGKPIAAVEMAATVTMPRIRLQGRLSGEVAYRNLRIRSLVP